MKISEFYAGKLSAVNAYQYKYFIPESINHHFEIDDNKVQIQLETSAKLLGELNAMARMVPNIDLFISSFIGNEATLSSKIEGTKTEIDESYKAESEIKPEHRDDWKEVRLYIQAITESIEELETTPISSRLIKSTHETLLSSGRGEKKTPGEYRTSQNWIGNSLADAEFIPPHHNSVIALMSDLEKFIHNKDILIPDLIKIAIVHYQFETIHPFLDGNGRVGRMLIPLYLVSNGLLKQPLLYMSAFFEANKNKYCRKLMQVRSNHNLSGWLLFFLKGIEQTARHSIDTLNKILSLKDELTKNIQENTGNRSANNLRMLAILFKNPFVSVDKVREKLSVSQPTARHIVDDLIKIKLLKEITGGKRNRIFAFNPYLDLLRSTPFPADNSL